MALFECGGSLSKLPISKYHAAYMCGWPHTQYQGSEAPQIISFVKGTQFTTPGSGINLVLINTEDCSSLVYGDGTAYSYNNVYGIKNDTVTRINTNNDSTNDATVDVSDYDMVLVSLASSSSGYGSVGAHFTLT